jgi:hypothetical protein
MSVVCPICAQHQTFSEPIGTSHMGQFRKSGTLLNHIIRSGEQRRRHGEAERFGGFEIAQGRHFQRDCRLACLLYSAPLRTIPVGGGR